MSQFLIADTVPTSRIRRPRDLVRRVLGETRGRAYLERQDTLPFLQEPHTLFEERMPVDTTSVAFLFNWGHPNELFANRLTYAAQILNAYTDRDLEIAVRDTQLQVHEDFRPELTERFKVFARLFHELQENSSGIRRVYQTSPGDDDIATLIQLTPNPALARWLQLQSSF